MRTLERINEIECKARAALGSPMLAMAAPGAKEAITELLEVVRGIAVDVENLRARQAIFEKLNRGE